MESLKNKKFDSFKESKISGLTNLIGGRQVMKTGAAHDDVGAYTNVGAGSNNDITVTKITDVFV